MARLQGTARGFETNLFEEALEAFGARSTRPRHRTMRDLGAEDYPAYIDILSDMVRERAGGAAAYTVTVHAMTLLDDLPNLLAALPGTVFVCLTRCKWDTALRLFLWNYDLLNNSYSYRLSDIMNRTELWRRAVDWRRSDPLPHLTSG